MLEIALEGRQRLVTILLVHLNSSLEIEEEETFAVPNYGSQRTLTLGERKSIASKPNRKLIELAARDPHPMVIVKLLNNPKLTEKDAVFIAARRPAPRIALVEFALHPRFRSNRSVAKALVNNPALPEQIALTLLPTLDLPYISHMASSHRFKPLIRETAAQILKLKRMRNEPCEKE